eukprot:XP_001611177.1 hypothetical protein [Babesia bovis T2Bo]
MHRKDCHHGLPKDHKSTSENFYTWLEKYNQSFNNDHLKSVYTSKKAQEEWKPRTREEHNRNKNIADSSFSNQRIETALKISPQPYNIKGEYRQNNRQHSRDKVNSDTNRGFDYRFHERDATRLNNTCSSNVTMERRGGLTWIRGSNGVLIPYIENTWLQQMITKLVSDSESLWQFMNTLKTTLMESVLFLYSEGIKPYLGDVANQMKRSIADNFWSASEVAFVSLHCQDTVDLRTELRVKGEMGWVVYLREKPPGFLGFVDTHSTVDPYSNYHWRALNNFAVDIMRACKAPVKNDNEASEGLVSFTGGRYAFAERLREEVHAFRSMRLGEVVHLVQLAIYTGVFVYAQRILLPVTACEKTAEEMFPRMKKARHPICSSLDEVRRIISLLVDNRKHGLVLAQLKQQFLMQFNKELNPITFGFRKLQNLLLSNHFNNQYQLFVPIDSPHRTHIQHRRYTIPLGCRAFQQSKIVFDPNKFWSPLDEWYDEPFESLNDLPANIQAALEDVLADEDEYCTKSPSSKPTMSARSTTYESEIGTARSALSTELSENYVEPKFSLRDYCSFDLMDDHIR